MAGSPTATCPCTLYPLPLPSCVLALPVPAPGPMRMCICASVHVPCTRAGARAALWPAPLSMFPVPCTLYPVPALDVVVSCQPLATASHVPCTLYPVTSSAQAQVLRLESKPARGAVPCTLKWKPARGAVCRHRPCTLHPVPCTLKPARGAVCRRRQARPCCPWPREPRAPDSGSARLARASYRTP